MRRPKENREAREREQRSEREGGMGERGRELKGGGDSGGDGDVSDGRTKERYELRDGGMEGFQKVWKGLGRCKARHNS